MKKWITAIVTATALLMALAGCASEKKDSQLETPVADSGKSVAQQAQTAESAIEIALNHAGKTREEVTRLRNEYDVDDGVASYEVEFVHADTEYAYDIQAETGAILKVETEKVQMQAPQSGTETPSAAATRLTPEEAKTIALKHAGVSSPRELKVELDRENGQEVYEIDFENETTDYDYTVDAYSGKVLKAEKETEKKPASGTTEKPSTTPTKPTVISKDEAKSIALKHAGVSSPRDLEVERDRENGKEVYEVSFESGKTEYDYHIDAYSGKILKSEKEMDD